MKNNFRKAIANISCFIISILYCQSQNIPPTQTFEELHKKVTSIFEDSQLIGVSMVVVNDSKILFQTSLGHSDVATKKPYNNTTLQNIGSVSKTYIAAALMKAQELGKLKLDDPINAYLPFRITHPKHPNIPITIKHLAQHTAGITDQYHYQKAYTLDNPDADYSHLPKGLMEYINIMKQNDTMHYSRFLKNVLSIDGEWYSKKGFTKTAPGKKYEYSNIGAALAAYVLEQATGLSFEIFTKNYIFDPLLMKNTSWKENEDNADQFASRYYTDGTKIPDYQLITTADGGLVTNTTDFSNYLIEMLNGAKGNGTILTPGSYKEMFTRTKIGNESSGIFWSVSRSNVLSHSGSDPGVVSIAAINPQKNVAAFIMTNSSADEDEELIMAIQHIWLSLKNHDWTQHQTKG